MIRLALAAAILSGAPACALAKSVPDAAGLYRISQMEMAGGLELSPDGRFLYAFDYGAVSEVSEGRWTFENGKVVLMTDPMPPLKECDRGFAIACFDRTTLVQDGDNWILYRWDARIVLKPDQPRPR